MEGKSVVPMEITYMDTKDMYTNYMYSNYIYSNPFRFSISTLGLPKFSFLGKAEREHWQSILNIPPMIKHQPDRIQNRSITLIPLFQSDILNFYISLLVYYTNPQSALLLECTSNCWQLENSKSLCGRFAIKGLQVELKQTTHK
jgi:hypothetical protein